MEKGRIILLAIALFIFLVIVSAAVFFLLAVEKDYFTPVAGKPYNFRIASEDDKINILFDVDIFNQNPANITFRSDNIEEGTIKFNGEKMGEIVLNKKEINLSKHAVTNVTFKISVEKDKLKNYIISHIENDEKSQIEFSVKINFKIHNISLKTSFYNGTASLDTSILENMDEEVKKISYPPFIAVMNSQSQWNVTGEKIGVDSSLKIQCLPFFPIPPEISFTANNINVADSNIVAKHRIFHGRNVEIKVETTFNLDSLDEWLESHMKKGETTLTAVIKYKMLRREIVRDVMKIKTVMPEVEMEVEEGKTGVKEVRENAFAITGIIIIWFLYALFVAGIYIKWRRR